jgi:DNA-binding NtrC family response regulator
MNHFSELKKVKTLLVDDDELIRDSLSIAFTNQGCFLRTAETADEGLQVLQKDRFDIIISDLRLPGKDGLQFLGLVRSCQPEALCVLITAYGDTHVASDASAMGIDDFIEKPFSVGVLVASVARLVQNRKHYKQKPGSGHARYPAGRRKISDPGPARPRSQNPVLAERGFG